MPKFISINLQINFLLHIRFLDKLVRTTKFFDFRYKSSYERLPPFIKKQNHNSNNYIISLQFCTDATVAIFISIIIFCSFQFTLQ